MDSNYLSLVSGKFSKAPRAVFIPVIYFFLNLHTTLVPKIICYALQKYKE